MSIALGTLLLFLQYLRICASGFVLESKNCADDRIGYSTFAGQQLFFINEDLVDKSLFCNSLQSYFINRCSIDELPGFNHCQFSHSPVKLNLHRWRKLLEQRGGNDNHHHKSNIAPDQKKKKKSNIAIFGIPGILIFVLICLSLCACFFKRRPNRHTVLPKNGYSTDSEANSSFHGVQPSPLRTIASPRQATYNTRFSMSSSPRPTRLEAIHLNFEQILQATQNFSPTRRIGKGAFGTVYKGQVKDGPVVAIKRAKRDHFKDHKDEFSREVELLSKIEHRNLVKLLGFIDEGEERLVITEYVPNGTLRAHLDGHMGRILNFNERLGIAIDVSHGLTYLHMYSEKPIIHRDVKSSNILLTNSMRAKVADFGFARLGAMDSEQSQVDTAVKGTVGYLDPEYMRTHKLTAKSDVYSFGIVLLEILTGRRPVDLSRPHEERVTLRWVFKKFEEGNVLDLMDPRMEEAVDGEILSSFFELAIQCAAPTRADRPDMKLVGEQLWGIRAEYDKRSKRYSRA